MSQPAIPEHPELALWRGGIITAKLYFAVLSARKP